ncbi:hypothetical protein DL96DRAFT_1823782 [Flagelloscypha sp. PMI_526]|nr:hypothetical protein DL96DRAFT_1823782 [Flagelloscypha sp. PMI_526]
MRILFVAALYVSSLFARPTAASPTLSVTSREEYVNEHHQNWLLAGGSEVHREDVPADIKAQIDAAIDSTRHLIHYYWTGTLPPHASREDSVESYARRAASIRGGTTLEDTIQNVAMPTWTRGEVFVFMGERVRPNNVWDTQEWPQLYINPNVPRMYRIIVHLTSEDAPFKIFDRLELPIDHPDHPPPPPPDPSPPPPPPAPPVVVDEKNSNIPYLAAKACRVWSSEGGNWYREDGEDYEDITWQVTELGAFYYGGAKSEKNNGAFTYSIVVDDQATKTLPSRSSMFDWLNAHPTFDARFADPRAYAPSEINFGTGWIPYATACPWNLGLEHLSNLKLRALPVGDGLTAGMRNYQGGLFQSNGYRYGLQQVLAKPSPRRIVHQQGVRNGPIIFSKRQDDSGGSESTNSIDFIGHTKSGDMDDNDNEGHPGAHISDLDQYLQPVIDERPNLVLLMAGTNDIAQDDDVAGAPGRLMKIVDHLSDALPNAAILVATIPVLGNDDQEARANAYNAEVNKLLLRRAADGRHVLAVPMENLTVEDLDDGIFPNEHGYADMAYQWVAGIWQAQAWGWIGPLDDAGGRPDGGSSNAAVNASSAAVDISSAAASSSDENSTFDKWMPSIIGLLIANLVIVLALVTLSILRRSRGRARSTNNAGTRPTGFGFYQPVQRIDLDHDAGEAAAFKQYDSLSYTR